MQLPRKSPLKPIRKTIARQFAQNKQKQQCSDQNKSHKKKKNSGLANTTTRQKIMIGKVAKKNLLMDRVH